VYNDAGRAANLSLGVEVQQTLFAFDRPGPLGDVVFCEFKLINKGTNTLTQMIASLWADPDLDPFEDRAGFDRALSLGYAYAGSDGDPTTIDTRRAPALGFDLLRGAIDSATGDTLGATAFSPYSKPFEDAGAGPVEYDNLMRGLDGSGNPVIDPTTGLASPFLYTGDPVSGTGWLAPPIHDERILLSSGPFTMAPGDTQVITGAIVMGQGADRLASIDVLRYDGRHARTVFEHAYVPPALPAPDVEVVARPDSVTLCWTFPAIALAEPQGNILPTRPDHVPDGYTFEGFNVYQGASPRGPWTRIATYDEVDRIREVRDGVLDTLSGHVVDAVVASGTDSGLRFCHAATRDTIAGRPLIAGSEYYFAVTAYAVGPEQAPRVLESPLRAIAVIPQRVPAGVDVAAAGALPVTYTQTNPTLPRATDRVVVEVVDPLRVTGHRYRVTFDALVPPFFGTVGSDTATVRSAWSLTDADLGNLRLVRQLNRRGDDDYAVVDGLRVKVVGRYFPALIGADFFATPDHPRPLTGVGALPYFFGGAGSARDFLGSALDPAAQPDSFTTVEVRFGGSQLAHRYLRLERASDGAAPPQGRGWLYGGLHSVPFSVWDVARNVPLEAAFVERLLTDDAGTILPAANQPATLDSTWGPDTSATGGHEYLFALKSHLLTTPASLIARDGAIADGTLPVLYALWSKKRNTTNPIEPGDRFLFDWVVPAGPNDVYEFDTSPALHGDVAAIREGLGRIRAVPNPYRFASTYDRPSGRVVRFINLPEVATIRIFSVGGSLVRTLAKNDPTSSVLEWNLETEFGKRVASGVYLYTVEAPGAGSTVGRLAVIHGQ
jgi:hypothetical protein